MSALSTTEQVRREVLNYPVDIVQTGQALSIVEAAWENHQALHLATLNAEMVIQAQNDRELDRIIHHADLIVPDGAGIVWALRLEGILAKRLPGIDLAEAILASAAQKQIKVALLGGRPQVMAALSLRLPRIYPRLNLVFLENGYYSKDKEKALVDRMVAADPQLILVALGVPKQELFIDRYRERFPHTVMIGVGGSFDVWSGVVKRAPAFFQALNLEWFYRLLCEPWRLERMGKSLPTFAWQVIKVHLKRKFVGNR
jgi:N-acetylglucosaminyldiphosphoundecaprenol N-acetyl-beta-D-mannosaminyltransferase